MRWAFAASLKNHMGRRFGAESNRFGLSLVLIYVEKTMIWRVSPC